MFLKNQLDLKEEKIITYLLEAHLGFLADLTKFVDCLSKLKILGLAVCC